MYGCVSRQDQVTEVVCEGSAAMLIRPTHVGQEQLSGAGLWSQPEKELLCQTGAEQGDFVWFANRHEERAYPGITALICRRAKFKFSRGTF